MVRVYCASLVSCRWTQQRSGGDIVRRTYWRLLGVINTRHDLCNLRLSLRDLTHA